MASNFQTVRFELPPKESKIVLGILVGVVLSVCIISRYADYLFRKKPPKFPVLPCTVEAIVEED